MISDGDPSDQRALTKDAIAGSISIRTAAATTVAFGAVAGAATSVAQDTRDPASKGVNLPKAALSAVGGALGSAAAAKLTMSPASKLAQMSKAGGVMSYIADLTRNGAGGVKMGTGAAQQIGQKAADVALPPL